VTAGKLSCRNTGESGKTHWRRHKTARSVNETETGTSRTVGARSVSAALPKKRCPFPAAFRSVPERKCAAIRSNTRAADVLNTVTRANSVARRRKVARGAAIHRARDAKSGSTRVNGRAACAFRSRANANTAFRRFITRVLEQNAGFFMCIIGSRDAKCTSAAANWMGGCRFTSACTGVHAVGTRIRAEHMIVCVDRVRVRVDRVRVRLECTCIRADRVHVHPVEARDRHIDPSRW
jgi:hypothetical protein